MAERIFVIVNPRAGKGRGECVGRRLLAALGASTQAEHAFTKRAGDEASLAAAALERGFTTLVAVGGDGTWGQVGDAIVRSGRPARLGLVAGGTGCDLARSLDVPARDVDAALRVIRDGHVRTIDVGRIGGRHFLNIAGFGYDVAVLENSWSVRFLRGAPLYVYCALRQMRAYRGFAVEIEADGQPARTEQLLMLIVANARFFGGAFHISPRADLHDGRLDAVAFGNAPTGRRLGLMARLMRGTHAAAPEVSLMRAARLRLRFAAPPAYETDGEWRQAQECELEIVTVPRALAVLAPPAPVR